MEKLDLTELITSPEVDTISGRATGEKYARDKKILEKLDNGEQFDIVIADNISAINDSFWKGFFSEIMKVYKTKDSVEVLFKVSGDIHFINSVKKNLLILESIFNSSTSKK